ncbi:MAG: TatD family hydrolase [Defluviitaleaceae bacterium]|nr:TatD family hydrolase [Defluviitaleaceae bacterium]
MIIDSHTHYNHKQFNEDQETLLNALPSQGISTVINIGYDLESSQASVEMAEAYPHVYATVGVHPHDAKTINEQVLKALEDLCTHKKVVAFGEIGLDFFHNFSPAHVQRKGFNHQLALAHKVNLPVVIHSRDANDEVFNMIEASSVRRGVIHSFSGDTALALKYVELGFYIGISGVITFDKSGKLQDTVAAIPLSSMLLETDCPYLTPKPYRGKRNNSTYLTFVAAEIAKIKGITAEAVYAQTSKNTKCLFGLGDSV